MRLVFGKFFNLLWRTFCYWVRFHCYKWPDIDQKCSHRVALLTSSNEVIGIIFAQ